MAGWPSSFVVVLNGHLDVYDIICVPYKANNIKLDHNKFIKFTILPAVALPGKTKWLVHWSIGQWAINWMLPITEKMPALEPMLQHLRISKRLACWEQKVHPLLRVYSVYCLCIESILCESNWKSFDACVLSASSHCVITCTMPRYLCKCMYLVNGLLYFYKLFCFLGKLVFLCGYLSTWTFQCTKLLTNN